MPVIGTPVPSAPVVSTDCSALSTLSPAVTQIYGVAIPTKRRALYAQQAQKADLMVTIFNQLGNTVDLTTCADTEPVFKIREVISVQDSDIFTVTGSIVDLDEGVVMTTLPTAVATNPGVYHVEVGLVDEDDELHYANQFYLWVNRGLFGTPSFPGAGPPTLDEVRLFIRDNGPEENFLLDDFEFDLAEVCIAAEHAVRYWNESQPPICVWFNTLSYPIRLRWMQSIAGHMFMMAAHRFRRNALAYQAAGLAIDDQTKFQQYDQVGMALTQDYREWVKQKKVQLNAEAAMTSSGSAYGARAYM